MTMDDYFLKDYHLNSSELGYPENIYENWKEIYKTTESRKENYTASIKIDASLRKTYLKFNYNIIDVPKLNITQRVDFIVDKICR